MTHNTGQRRRRKKACRWRERYIADRQHFVELWWREKVGEWVGEAVGVAKQYREMDEEEREKKIPEFHKRRVFSVVDLAKRYLDACGPEIYQLVGNATIAYLEGECTRLVASRLAPHLNVVAFDHTRYVPKHRLEKLGPRSAP